MATWDVFREMENLRREMDQVFRGFGMGRLLAPTFLHGLEFEEYPRVNISEDENNVYVDALVPGIEPQNINLNVMKGTLTLSGERKEEPGERAWHRRERGTGKFLRAIELPVGVDAERVDARYQSGILTITLPRSEEAKPKKIAIKAK
jgi:HSP20 family protein